MLARQLLRREGARLPTMREPIPEQYLAIDTICEKNWAEELLDWYCQILRYLSV